jgi:predicted lipid-binding transport protein (Tim44 family)
MILRRRVLLIALAAALLALAIPASALAAAGGGTSGFSSGGEGGGGGFTGGGGGHGKGFAIYLIFRALFDIALLGHGLGLLVLVGLGLLYWFVTRVLPRLRDAADARREQGRAARRTTERRERRVQLAAAVAADENSAFDPDRVKPAAAQLFTAVQTAWTNNDRARLRELVAPDLLAEWERRLDDFERRGWRNHVEPLGPPEVEYVGLRNPGAAGTARATVRIEARMRDYVTDRTGRKLRRRGRFTETVRLREYWTLALRDQRWILSSIEQGAEGSHTLSDEIVAADYADDRHLRDEALIEQAVADAAPPQTAISDLTTTTVAFADDARAAALDLSLDDGRFAPDVLEIAARQAVAAWAEAVDGPDDHLRALAGPGAVADLLHPGDPSRRTRIVVRGPQLRGLRIAALDAHSEPPTMTVDVDVRGRRYIQDRNTAQILAGNAVKPTDFTERWTFALSGDAAMPWRIVAVASPAIAV